MTAGKHILQVLPDPCELEHHLIISYCKTQDFHFGSKDLCSPSSGHASGSCEVLPILPAILENFHHLSDIMTNLLANKDPKEAIHIYNIRLLLYIPELACLMLVYSLSNGRQA